MLQEFLDRCFETCIASMKCITRAERNNTWEGASKSHEEWLQRNAVSDMLRKEYQRWYDLAERITTWTEEGE